ncbi:MAG: hypothetical protein ACYC9L_05675 [Sulfuricaulis sp.]
MNEATVTVAAVAQVKEGTNAKGKPWKKWAFKGSDGNWYSSFTEGIGTRFVKGETLSLEYSEDDYGRTIKSLKDTPPEVAAAISSDKADEERRIVREVAWKAAVVLAENCVPGVVAPQDALKIATKLAHAIEHDIYRTTPQPAKEEADDIPF